MDFLVRPMNFELTNFQTFFISKIILEIQEKSQN
jgi:hypothetical protein